MLYIQVAASNITSKYRNNRPDELLGAAERDMRGRRATVVYNGLLISGREEQKLKHVILIADFWL